MASNMTTVEKLKHPIAAVKGMMHKDHTTDDTTNTKASSLSHETGVTRTTPTNIVNEEQLMGGTPTIGTTVGSASRPVYSETGTGHHTGLTGTGHHTGLTGATGLGATGLAGYEAEKHLGHHGQHTGTHMGQGVAGAGLAGTGAAGLAGYEADKHLGHHGHHTGTHLGQGMTSTGVTGTGLGHHGHHTGTHIGEGIAGAGVVGAAGYEAEKHLGHHGHHTGTGLTGTGNTGYTTTAPGYTTTAPGYSTTGTGYTDTGNTGYTSTGTTGHTGHGHHGHHNRHHDDAAILANDPGLPGTTGVRGEVYTPNQPRPSNFGLNVIGANTPLNTSDYRNYDLPQAQGNVTRSDLANEGRNINEERIEKTSLPANPLMSALTGGKIPPSIHEGAKQAGLHGGTASGTGAEDITRSGVTDTTRTGMTGTGHTGTYGTSRRDVI